MKKQFNPFRDIQLVERNGRIFILHWRYRYDPVTMTIVAASAMAAGTGISMYGQIQQGKQAEQIANANATVEETNAQYAKQNAIEQAKIQAERGRRLVASQQAGYAAGGVKMNVGAPLVVEAQTQADLAKDVGFTLNQGEQAFNLGMSQAAITRQVGANAKNNSYWNAAATGLKGFGSIAMMGVQGGLFKGGAAPTSKVVAGGGNTAGQNWSAIKSGANNWMNTP